MSHLKPVYPTMKHEHGFGHERTALSEGGKEGLKGRTHHSQYTLFRTFLQLSSDDQLVQGLREQVEKIVSDAFVIVKVRDAMKSRDLQRRLSIRPTSEGRGM